MKNLYVGGLIIFAVLILVSLVGCSGDPGESMKVNQTAAGCAVEDSRCYL